MKTLSPPLLPAHAGSAAWLRRLAGAGLVLAGLLGCLAAAPAIAQGRLIETALAADAAPGAASAAASRPVALPDDWSRSRPGRAGRVSYRAQFDAGPPQLQELQALLVDRACSSLAVSLNGQLVHGRRPPEASRGDCHRPHLVVLPPALLHEGGNTLDIEVAGLRLEQVSSRLRAGGLSALRVGALDELQPLHAREVALRVTLPQAVGATLLLTGSFMFVLGFFNRRESHLAYFGALSVGWALVDARLWLAELPLPLFAAEVVLCSMFAFIAWAAVQFLLRYAQVRHALVDLALPLQCAAMPLTLVAAGAQHLNTMVFAWVLLLAAEVGAAAVFYLHRHRHARGAGFWLMAALLTVVAASGAVNLAVQLGAVPSLAWQAAQLATPLMFVGVGLRLVQQHGRALQQAEAGRAHLEQRVREATAEIERNFRQIAELKIEQVTERERKRIAADLHDDLGAKLLTIVHTSDSERISTLAREALEEMRLSVRGLTGRPVRLSDALGDWRAEVVSRLAQAGIVADWSAPDDLHQTLSARAYVQTTRILREATSNIIKHSGASYCKVVCQVADGDFQFVLQDNGEGIRPEGDGGRLDRGHGMATMKQRAKQMQGQCLIESGPGFGTVMRLTLPLDRALESS